MNIKNQKDFFCGVMYIVVGGAFAWGSSTYKMGSATRMGPGYFPFMLSVLLAAIGVGITVKSLSFEAKSGDKIGKWAWKPLFFIIAANIVFGILLAGLPSIKVPTMGLIVSIYALTFTASMANAIWSFKETLILATLLAISSYLAFVLGLGLNFQVWPTFITG